MIQFLRRFYVLSICVSIVFIATLQNQVIDPNALDDWTPPSKPTARFPQDEHYNDANINIATPNSSKTTRKFWRFDEAAPKIWKAKTHFLQSIPLEHRLPILPDLNMTEYASQASNTFPQKLHLYEINPCIAVLPLEYRDIFATSTAVPIYIVVYRVTHKNNCYDGHVNLQLLGGKWDATNTDYLGVALLDVELSIVHEGIFTFTPRSRASRILPYNDYRIFNLRGDQLYLTSMARIVPMYLSKYEDDSTFNKTFLVKVPRAFSSQKLPFRVYIRDFAACPVYASESFTQVSSSKNLLYFVSHDANATNKVRVVHNARYNPNDVRVVELDTRCRSQNITPYNEMHDAESNPDASFHTIDEQLVANNPKLPDIFFRDRGSACCIETTNPANNNGTPVFIAIVHPKTVYPGKNLPKGVAPNTYLSRLIAFESEAPYRIVARSGMFCLGYPNATEELNTTMDVVATANTSDVAYQNPLATGPLIPLNFAGIPHNCPRIHFVMGMIDKVVVDDDNGKGADSKNVASDGRVLISYGVSDCLSRIVEVSKDDINAMLWPT